MTPRQTRIAELGEQINAVRAEMIDLEKIEATELTDEQTARMEVIPSEFDTMTAERDKLVEAEAAAERVRSAAEIPANREAPAVHVRTDPFEVDLSRMSDTGYEIRDAALRAFETRQRGVSEAQQETLLTKIETIPGVARHALVNGSRVYRDAWLETMRAQVSGRPAIYTPEQADAIRASLSLTSANGGYSLPTHLDPTLIHTGTASKVSLRSVSRVEQGTTDKWNGVSIGNVTTYWKAEGSAFTDGSPTEAGPQVDAAMLTAYVTGSYEIFEDSNLLSQLPGLIGESFDFAEADAFVTGSGSDAPKGIITCLSGTAGVTITCTTRGSFTTASAVDVFALLNAIPSRYEDGATWVANKATFNTIKQMSTGSNGSYFWTDFNAAVGSPLLGSPILQSSTFSAATTSGTKLMVLGDFSQFLIYDRIGTTVEVIQNVVDGSGLPTGQRGLVAHKRVGSNVTDQNAFRVLNT